MKYILFKENEKDKYFRIKAIKNFGKGLFKIKKDEIGGIVSSENVLSQEGNCWIKYGCCAINSTITDNVLINNNAQIINSIITDDVHIYNNVKVINSEIHGKVQLFGNTKIINNCKLSGNIIAMNNTIVIDNVEINSEKILFKENAFIQGPIKITQKNIIINNNILKNISSMLLVRYGNPNKNNNYKVYKLVKSTNEKNVYNSIYDEGFKYDLNKSKIIKESLSSTSKNKLCDKGIHVSFDEDYNWGTLSEKADTIFTCFVNVNDILSIDFDNYNNCKIRANKIKVQNIREYPIINKNNSLKIIHNLNTKNILFAIYHNKTFETYDFFKALSITKNILYVQLDINIEDSIDNYFITILGPQKKKNISLTSPPRFYKCNIIGNHDNIYQINHKLNSRNIITIVYDYKTKTDVTLHTMTIFEDLNICKLKFDKILEKDNEYRILLINPSASLLKNSKMNNEKGIANTTPYFYLYTFNGIDCFEKEDDGEYSIIISHSLSTLDVYGNIMDIETSEIQPLYTYLFTRMDENNVKITFLKMPDKGHRYTLFLTRC